MPPYVVAVFAIPFLTITGGILWAVKYHYGPTEEHPQGQDVIRFEERH